MNLFTFTVVPVSPRGTARGRKTHFSSHLDFARSLALLGQVFPINATEKEKKIKSFAYFSAATKIQSKILFIFIFVSL
jgi:hypothetical protein